MHARSNGNTPRLVSFPLCRQRSCHHSVLCKWTGELVTKRTTRGKVNINTRSFEYFFIICGRKLTARPLRVVAKGIFAEYCRVLKCHIPVTIACREHVFATGRFSTSACLFGASLLFRYLGSALGHYTMVSVRVCIFCFHFCNLINKKKIYPAK